MTELLVAFQRRIIGAVMLAVAAKLGLGEAGTTRAQNVALAVSALVPSLGYLWSYLQRTPRRELYRRLVAAVVPALYAILAVLAGDLADSERATIAQQIGALLHAILGEPSPEVLALMGGASVMGAWSFASENKLRPARLGSPNP